MPDEPTLDSTEIPDEADDLYPREGCSAQVPKNVLCEECGEYHKLTAARMTARVRGGPGWR